MKQATLDMRQALEYTSASRVKTALSNPDAQAQSDPDCVKSSLSIPPGKPTKTKPPQIYAPIAVNAFVSNELSMLRPFLAILNVTITSQGSHYEVNEKSPQNSGGSP